MMGYGLCSSPTAPQSDPIEYTRALYAVNRLRTMQFGLCVSPCECGSVFVMVIAR